MLLKCPWFSSIFSSEFWKSDLKLITNVFLHTLIYPIFMVIKTTLKKLYNFCIANRAVKKIRQRLNRDLYGTERGLFHVTILVFGSRG
jgi:hypothetical protein